MHVAKTSGTAVTYGLLDAIKPRRPVGGLDRFMFGSYSDFSSLSSNARDTVHGPSTLPSDADFVHGHFALSTTRQCYPDAQFLTLLREPRVRLMSLWRFWRIQTQQTMNGWGSWADIVRRSHAPLETFLGDPLVACQTDNMAVRMLLWPHAFIPEDGFIDPSHDEALLAEARRRLEAFDYSDVVENRAMPGNLGAWLGLDFQHRRLNETAAGDNRTRWPLHRDLTNGCLDLLESRSRLDRVLWDDVARRRLGTGDPGQQRERAFIRAVAQYAM
ncbi:hypothetical protein [Lichenicoccus sp.]|uniref:hypothetical protein n=1 Tax=Lichenicoccus sp. TaxID=2781899 RepID=UPI003D11D06E